MALWERERVTLLIEQDVVRMVGVLAGRVTRWGSAPLPRNALRDGYVGNEAALAQVLERLWVSQGGQKPVPRDNIVLGIPAQHALYKVASLQGEEQRLPAMNERARELLPEPNLYRAWQVVGGKENPALFVVATPADLVDGYVAALQRAGLGVSAVDIKTLALIRAVACQQTVIVDGEREQGSVIIVNEALLHKAVFPILDAPLLHSPEEKITRLTDALAQAIAQFNRDFPTYALHAATPIFLTGSLADHPLLRDSVQELLGHPIGRVAAPVVVPPDMPLAQFAANLGLSQKRL